MKSSKIKTTTFSLGPENSETSSKKVSVLSTGLFKARKKSSTKVINENELMILAPPPQGESMLKHAIPIPSENPDNILDDQQIIQQVTNHLKEISSSLERTYGFDLNEDQLPEQDLKSEGEEHPPTEDMTTFLLLCSSIANQLEEAGKEEQQILESLFKWFQQEVYHVEELVKEQNVSGWKLPLPDKAVSTSIAQVMERLQRLGYLRNRVSSVTAITGKAVTTKHKLERQREQSEIYEDIKKMIEDFNANFVNNEFIENIMDIADKLFLTESTEPKDLQFQEMFKIIEKQAYKLQQLMNDTEGLEFKCKLIQNDLDVATEERMILENELIKIKGPEKTEQLLQREKAFLEFQRKKLEKLKDSSKGGDLERLSMDIRTSSGSLTQLVEGQSVLTLDTQRKSSKEQMQKGGKLEAHGQSSLKGSINLTSSDAVKLKEELIQAQRIVISLESKNRFLEEQLEEALQDAEKAKKDLEASNAQMQKESGSDNESIASKKGKKDKKGKGKSKKDKAKTSKAEKAKTAG
ncbi:coiled-coil domain-containing protein 7 isoform X2 [Macrotis lagotis]|uniref:coiled-coil domain-containing protein 7 isoform X2 n=1 Tax=Macrotis lagotis TaxID=92651 RepID=UPI003D680AA3